MAKKNSHNNISSRITVRPFRLSDADDMWSYVTNPEMSRYTPVPWKEGMFKSKQDVESYIQHFCIPHRYCRSVCIDGRSIGMMIITPTNPGSWRKGNFGGLLTPEYWAKGVGTRAAEIAMVDAFRTIPEMVRLEAYGDVENKGVPKTLERIGFQREGVLRKFMFHRGKDRDVVLYSMLVDDEKRLALVQMLSTTTMSRL